MASGALLLHLGHAILHQAEKTVNVNGQSGAPLLVRHLIDWRIIGRPDTMVAHNNIQSAELFYSSIHQETCRAAGRKLRFHRDTALASATLSREFFCFRSGLMVVEHNARAGLRKQPHNRSAYPA